MHHRLIKEYFYYPWYLVATETHFHVLPVKYQGTLLKIKFAIIFPQYVL